MTDGGETSGDLDLAMQRIDSRHREDPKELALDHAMTVYRWVMALRPQASDALRVAARAQHIRRWQVPRDSYPRDRAGYLRWRSDLLRFHAAETAGILEDCGFGVEFVERVAILLRKEKLAEDAETRTLEDALCLAFMERQLADFAARQPEAKLRRILRKTWAKMSPDGRAAALRLPLPEPIGELLSRSVCAAR